MLIDGRVSLSLSLAQLTRPSQCSSNPQPNPQSNPQPNSQSTMPSTSHTAISLLCALSIILLLHHIPSTGATKLKHPPSAATSSDAAIQCQVVVAGGGFGGVAAAFAAASRGVLTCLVSESQWLGGQATSQAVVCRHAARAREQQTSRYSRSWSRSCDAVCVR